MISSNDFRPGVTIELNGDPHQVIEFQHVKPGKGAAFVRTKVKNLKTGSTTEMTFRGGEKVPKATLDRRNIFILMAKAMYLWIMKPMIKSALVLNNLMEAINSSKKIWIAKLCFIKGMY